MLRPINRILIHTDEVSEAPDAEHRNVVKLSHSRWAKQHKLNAVGLILRSKTTYVWDGEAFSERSDGEPP